MLKTFGLSFDLTPSAYSQTEFKRSALISFCNNSIKPEQNVVTVPVKVILRFLCPGSRLYSKIAHDFTDFNLIWPFHPVPVIYFNFYFMQGVNKCKQVYWWFCEVIITYLL